ncbi:formylglycine-generating enzyme family protein [Metabacillus herbersteinensis]|uniref:Formylglycine-generating enzyme family protein n=1 Tax=Metabacillus herbersteinensis TaxID=283816 RepID=A0ABV6GMA7_9BACI
MPDSNKRSCCSVSRNNSTNSSDHDSFPTKPSSKEDIIKDMIYIPGGEFLMGTDYKKRIFEDGEGPIRNIKINPFYIDPTSVSNQSFQTFVEETKYITEAEKFGWSFIFHSLVSEKIKSKVRNIPSQAPWWYVVEGAYWKRPEGPGSTIVSRMDHPVVHVSWNDAIAYCKWAGKRLLTETEWEFAARGGLEQKIYPWGNELTPNGEFQCNIWQGTFPTNNTKEDGYLGTAPISSYKPNGYGLYNMVGNVWEWCSDWFSRSLHNRGGRTNPKGSATGQAKVIRGGSYLCHYSYCNRYRVAARSSNTPDSSTGNMGFRCALNT